ncbi:unnamed protein product [Brassica oleracea var. botrytis]|uniref:(rape) hypothetical protein n=1 Tax=Brassica napus TaxID=3708 RepID=A0A816J0N2_BRANA|nr:unnamed protein product [Brassica napus]
MVEVPSPLNHHHPGSYLVTSLTFVDPSRISSQRVFGNKWTEIQRWIQAGRISALMVLQVMIDKAVNRFTRLRVKRANHEPMASENNSNKKRMFFLQYETSIANRTRI